MLDKKDDSVGLEQPQCLPTKSNDGKQDENNLTTSTKHSNESLICKTPQESSNEPCGWSKDEINEKTGGETVYTALFYLGTVQILFGLLMAIFGVLVIVNEAALAQLGGGLWGGCLAVASGTAGVLVAAKTLCPLKSSAQKVAHTVFLALCLISVAVSQLVLVLAATGLARDINRSSSTEEIEEDVQTTVSFLPFSNLSQNYLALLSNAGLLLVSAIQCICAAAASYRSSKALCSCFIKDLHKQDHQVNDKDAFVNSWLGKHGLQLPLYVVTASHNKPLNRKSLYPTPMLTLSTPILQPPPATQIMGYPLIPAPLGPVPSPVIRLHPKEMQHHRKHHRYHSPDCQHVQHMIPQQRSKKKKSKSKNKEPEITTEELVQTYTGLDRTIAEEFIEICNNSRNTSMYSDSSCCNGSNSDCTGCCTSSCTMCNTTDSESALRIKKL